MRTYNVTTKWIPCEVKLPPFWDLVWVTTESGRVDMCILSHLGYWVNPEGGRDDWLYNMNSVVAWMPFWEPPAYGMEDENNDEVDVNL